VINHSQQPRNPTDNSMFSQIRTRVIIHETTSILPCRGGGGGSPTWPITTRYRLFGRLERIPTQITLMDVVKSASYSQESESADNVMGVSAPVVLRLPPGHVHNYGFLLAHLRRLVGCEKQRLFSSCPIPPGTVDLTQPSRPGLPAQCRAAWAPRVLLSHSNCRSAPRAACGRGCSSAPQTHHPDHSQRLTPPSKHTGPG
jgi:hypothetical protein